MNGEEALNAYTLAASLVKQGKYEEALAVPMLESDRAVIQQRIDYANTEDYMKYMDDRLGFVDADDQAWMMDDFGNLVRVPFSIPQWHWQAV